MLVALSVAWGASCNISPSNCVDVYEECCQLRQHKSIQTNPLPIYAHVPRSESANPYWPDAVEWGVCTLVFHTGVGDADLTAAVESRR